MRLEVFARDPAILLITELVVADPPLPGKEWADLYWIRRDTRLRLACKTVFHGDPGPEIEVFLYGIPTERTRWAWFPWHYVPLEIGTEYLMGLEPAPERTRSKRHPTFEPGDFDSLERLASSRPRLVASVPEIVAVEHMRDLDARLAQQLRWLEDPDLERAGYAVRAVVARWHALEKDTASADDLETALALAALLSRTFGPLIVVPGVTCIMALSLTSYPQLIDRARVVIAALVASWLVPVALEWAGVLAPTWSVGAGEVTSSSALIGIGGRPTIALLVAAHVVTIIVIGLFASALVTSRRNAQRQLEIQAWHLRQLLPPGAE